MDTNKDTLFARWLSGELTQEEQQQLQKGEALGDLEAIVKATDDLQLPKYDAEAAYAQFKKKQPIASKPTANVRSINIRLLLAVAATFAIVIVGYQLWDNRAVVSTAQMASTLHHTLPDQSEILLNDGSSIKYERSTWEANRTVALIGEAYFQVQKGSTFQVKTAKGIVEVLGTQFNVRAWGDKLHVECYEGSVRVTSRQQATTLTANQSVNVVNGQMGELEPLNHQQPLWSTGNSRFHEENINQVFAELERQYNVTVEAPTMNRPFSGSFRHDDLESALRAICLPMQLEYAAEGSVITIVR